MKTRLFFIGCCTATLVFTSSCGKDNPLNPLDGCGSASWAERVEAESTALSQASSTYSGDPTVANCQSFKTAYVNYLEALEDVRACVPGATKDAFEQAIAAAKKDIQDETCTES
tara:strand:+ start:1174 stop:1515 length:342 start_codon:yes stop_codon:yes gene_type:complete